MAFKKIDTVHIRRRRGQPIMSAGPIQPQGQAALAAMAEAAWLARPQLEIQA